MNKVIAAALTLVAAATAAAADTTAVAAKSLLTQLSPYVIVHGTIRPRFEYAASDGDYRFQVRNARLSVSGNVCRQIGYLINTDMCDRGKMKILDAWVRAELIPGLRGLSLQAGQFRMPFGVESFRGPNTYVFANRSFVGKQMCNYRAVGGMLSYDFASFPLKLQAGAFNPSSIGDHTGWHSSLAAAGKATVVLGDFTLSTGGATIRPHAIRANLTGFSAGFRSGRLTAEAEYMYKHYVNGAHKPAHAYCVFADWWMPVSAGLFNRLSFQARFDGLTAHSDTSAPDETGPDGPRTLTTDPARNRITAGTTLSWFKHKDLFFDIRLNYEKYFYHSGFTPTPDNADKLTAELVLRF